MNDDQLTSLLESLPRERTTREFTDQIIHRLARPPRVFPARLTVMAAAAVLILALAGLGLREWQHYQARLEATAQLHSLLAEKEELDLELRSLRRLATEARPVVYLGGNEKVDLVLDLARFHRRGGFRSDLAAQPTSSPPGPLPDQRIETLKALY